MKKTLLLMAGVLVTLVVLASNVEGVAGKPAAASDLFRIFWVASIFATVVVVKMMGRNLGVATVASVFSAITSAAATAVAIFFAFTAIIPAAATIATIISVFVVVMVTTGNQKDARTFAKVFFVLMAIGLLGFLLA